MIDWKKFIDNATAAQDEANSSGRPVYVWVTESGHSVRSGAHPINVPMNQVVEVTPW